MNPYIPQDITIGSNVVFDNSYGFFSPTPDFVRLGIRLNDNQKVMFESLVTTLTGDLDVLGCITSPCLTVGSLTATNFTVITTTTTTTSALSVLNIGPGPALFVKQGPAGLIGTFINNNDTEVLNVTQTGIYALSLSGDANGLFNIPGSPSWDSAYTTVNAYSASWNNTYNTVNTNSGSWGSVYNNVNSLSGGWSGTQTNVNINSGLWTAAYNNLVTNSASYLSGFDITLFANNSGKWDSTYNTVNTNSANWNNAYNGNLLTTNISAASITVNNSTTNFSDLSGATLQGAISGVTLNATNMVLLVKIGNNNYGLPLFSF